MLTVAILIGLMVLGFLLGYLAPSDRTVNRVVSICTSVLVYMLLFTLGMELGLDKELIAKLGTLGLQSVFVSVCCIAGSVAMGFLFGKVLHRGERASSEGGGGIGKALLGSMSYLLVFAVGVVAGVVMETPLKWMEGVDVASYLLYGLMVVVGFSVGSDKASLSTIRHLSPKLLLLPLATVVGTFIGSTVAYLVLKGFVFGEISAIGAGYGYYSLSSVLIGETVRPVSHGAMLGSVALISNICREVLSILLAGPFARWFGPLAPICSAGATSMDTTLPFVVRASGSKYAVVSVYHGVFMTILCPILVGLFLQL